MNAQTNEENNSNKDSENKYNISVEKKPKSRVEIQGEIPWSELESQRDPVLDALRETVEIDGFRKGKIPEKVLVDHVGEEHILNRMAQRALQAAYPSILRTHAPKAIGQPNISITKLAEGNPLGFKAEVAVLPEISLPDYKKIAKKQNADVVEVEVDEEDVQEAIDRIRKQWVQSERMEKIKNLSEKDEEGMMEDAAQMDPSQMQVDDEDLPELTDEFVQQLGEFEGVEDFKSKLRSNILQQEQRKAREKQRIGLIEEIVENSEMEVPEMVVESELDRMVNQFKADVEHAGVEFEEYLDNIDKSLEDLRNEWRPDAKKQAQIQLVLNKIAAEEGIDPEEAELEEEIQQIKQQYENVDEDRVRTYVGTMLRNEKVFEYLENLE